MPEPKIDQSKCSKCYNCLDICPMEVFDKDDSGKVSIQEDKECVGCNACAINCPEECIKVNQ